jgi:hypothetical protein
MDNLDFNSNNLSQNSENFWTILYKLLLNICNNLIFIQPYVINFVILILVMRYNKIKKELANIPNTESTDIIKSTDVAKPTEIIKTTNIVELTDIIKSADVQPTETTENVQQESTIKPNNIIQDIDLVEFRNEIKALRKDLSNFHQYADFVQDMLAEEAECFEAECCEDKENNNKHKKSEEFDEIEESTESEYSDESNVCDMCLIKNRISTMTPEDIENLIQICAEYVLIPTWFTKEDFHLVSNVKLSNNSWKKLLECANDVESKLFDDANKITISWFKDNKSLFKHSNKKKSESDEEDNVEDNEEENNDDNENDDNDDEVLNKLIVTQLKNCNYQELKKIAGVKSNTYKKEKLIEIIGKKNDKLAILKALKFIL